MNILGVSAYYHDSGAALLRDGEIVAATHEERYTRIKHDNAFPKLAVQFCLDRAGITIGEVDHVVYYEKPLLKFERVLFSLLGGFPRNLKAYLYAMPLWLRDQLFVKAHIREATGYKGRILFVEHHLSHAASAFYCSPFDKAAVLTADGVGEWATGAMGVADERGIRFARETHFPHSVGLVYTAFTFYLGFKPNSGEYKVMGLAPYGEPRFLPQLLEVAPIAEDGSVWLDMRYFDFLTNLRMTNDRFHQKFGGPPRPYDAPEFTQREYDLAASIQAWTETAMVRSCRHLHKETGLDKLVMAGGVALNCTANTKILEETDFDEIFIQPAAGDAGGALGCALAAHHLLTGEPNRKRRFDAYLGDDITREETLAVLEKHGARFRELSDEDLCREVAERIERGRVIGWCQGRMEFGPRALGSRSIMADPRDPKMKDHLNEAIKLREGFRPFAPSVLKEHAASMFELPQEDCDYMLFVARVREGVMPVPAITHVDRTARLQTVPKDVNPLYHRAIECFFERTGCPLVVNTSFNVRGEAIVRTPFEAYRCFMATGIDDLAVGPFLLAKEDQDYDPSINYLDTLQPD